MIVSQLGLLYIARKFEFDMNKNREILAEVETLLQCNDHLEFVKNVLARSTVSASVKAEIDAQIDRIEQRQQDPNLYLAVIGEFSSGKSTFINALLKDELLKTSALVTTATPTKICYGKNLQLEVNFSGNRPPMVIEVNGEILDLDARNNPQLINIKNFIHTITSERSIAKDVVNVTIEHPSSFLANGITIIDTPGTNDDLEPITRQVVEEEADLAIVIIPATIPLSETLANFINNSLHSYLHRCIFVVSRIDQIRAREQDKTLASLQKRLSEKLAVAEPMLYPCSAQVSLDLMNGDEVESKDLEWQQRFIELEAIVIERLNRGKTICIAESLVRLLDRLFHTLDRNLEIQRQEYAAQQAQLQAETIPNLSQFTVEQYSFCDNKLQASIAKYLVNIKNSVNSHRESVSNSIRARLFEMTNEDGLKNLLQSEIENMLTADRQHLQQDLENIDRNLIHEVMAIGRIFDRKFTDVYTRLASLGGRIEMTARNSYNSELQASNLTFSAQTLTQKLDSDDGRKMGIGAAAGFVIGSLLLPGLGTAVGVAAGSWASRLFAPSLQQRQQKLWEELQPNIKSYFDTLETNIDRAYINRSQELGKSLKVRIDSYIDHYQSIVETILQAQALESRTIEATQNSIAKDAREIENRKNRLSEQRHKLAAIDV